MRRFRDLHKSGEYIWKINPLCIVLYSFLYEFYFEGFSYKVFSEAISALCMLYHLIFSHKGFLGDDILRVYTWLSWCFLLYFPIGFLRSFILIYQCTSKFFPQGFQD
jgi:hypothetical protein